VVVGDIAHPYRINEIEMEEGVERPPGPEPGTTHTVLVWALETIEHPRYVVTDAIAIELDADWLYPWDEFKAVIQESYACDLDPSVQDAAPFAFYAYSEDLEIEVKYPAEVAFIIHDGRVEEVPGEFVACVVRYDPENY
jgi:hypothetical protein